MGTVRRTGPERRRMVILLYLLLLSSSLSAGGDSLPETLLRLRRLSSPPDLLLWERSGPSLAEADRRSLPQQIWKRDNRFGWTSFTNNMDVLRGHLKERIEVARRRADRVQSLGDLGRK